MDRPLFIRIALTALLTLLLVPGGMSRDPITGKWKFAFEARGWSMELPVVLEARGETVTATAGDVVVNGTFRGNHLVLAGKIDSNETGAETPLRLTGRFHEGEIRGDVEFDIYEATFKARRAE